VSASSIGYAVGWPNAICVAYLNISPVALDYRATAETRDEALTALEALNNLPAWAPGETLCSWLVDYLQAMLAASSAWEAGMTLTAQNDAAAANRSARSAGVALDTLERSVGKPIGC
jgi:hypothetical protein